MIFKLICVQGKIGEGGERETKRKLKNKSEKQDLGRKCFSENSLLWDRTGCVDNGKKGRWGKRSQREGKKNKHSLFKDKW